MQRSDRPCGDDLECGTDEIPRGLCAEALKRDQADQAAFHIPAVPRDKQLGFAVGIAQDLEAPMRLCFHFLFGACRRYYFAQRHRVGTQRTDTDTESKN